MPNTLSPPPLARLFVGTIAVIVFGVLVLIVVTLNRGFEFGDEAFVYSMISSNRGADNEFWGFHHLLHPLWQLTGESVLAFRILRLMGYVSLGVVCTLVARRILRLTGVELPRVSWLLVGLTAQIGTMAAWSYPPRYLGYNELSALLAQLAGAIMILILAKSTGIGIGHRRGVGLALWASLGAIMVVIAFAKITSIAVIGLLILVILIVAKRPLSTWQRCAALGLGAVAAIAVLVLLGVPVLEYLTRMVQLLLNPGGQSENGYTVSTLLIDYANSAVLTAKALVVPTALLVITLFSVRLGLKSRVRSGEAADSWALARGGAVIAALLFAAVVVLPIDVPIWDGLGVGVATVLLVAIVALLTLRWASPIVRDGRDPAARAVAIGVIVFIAAPLANALGTNNPLIGQTIFSATLWSTGAALGLALLWHHSLASGPLRAMPGVIALALIVNSALGVAADVFVHPYNVDPYFSQKTSTTLKPLRGIVVSESDAALIDWLGQTARDQQAAGVPTTMMANAGALLAFNNSDWASPWMGPFSAPNLARSCSASPPDRLFLLQPASQKPGAGPYEAVVEGLQQCGISFPSDFTKVSAHADVNPERAMTLWLYER